MYYLIFHFFVYGILGWCVEVAYAGMKEGKFVNRGFLNGPICPVYGIGVSAVVLLLGQYKDHTLFLYAASVVLVTILEWLTGFVLEKVFHNKWWDYSGQPWNLNGYVCLVFSLMWGIACVFIVKFLHPIIHSCLTYIPYILGFVLLVILCIVMFADLYTTVTAILNMNKHLQAMTEIAKELHRLSNELGENIYKEVNEAMVKRDELKIAYQELKDKSSKISKRLVRAFPKMKPHRYKEVFEDWRNYLRKK